MASTELTSSRDAMASIPSDHETVFVSVLEAVLSSTGADAAVVHLVSDGLVTYRATLERGAPLRMGPLARLPHLGGTTEEILRTGRPVLVPDTFARANPHPRVLQRGIRSGAHVPIWLGGAVVGTLNAEWAGVGACSPDHITALEEIARQVGGMVAHVGARAEVEHRTREVAIIAATTAAIAAALDLEVALRALLDGVSALTGAAAGAVRLAAVPSQPGPSRIYRWRGGGDYVWEDIQTLPGSVTADVLIDGRGRMVADNLAAAAAGVIGAREGFELHGVRSSLIVPLHAAYGNIGTLHANSPEPHEFSEAQIGPLQVLADHAGGAVERIRLLAEREELLAREQAAREAARLEAAEKAAILDQMSDGVLVLDAAGRVALANPAAAAFYEIDQACFVGVDPLAGVGRGSWPWTVLDESGEVVPPHDRPLGRALRGEAATAEQHVILVDGRERWASVAATPLRGVDGVASGAVLVIRDVTARREAQRLASQSEKLRLLGQMAGGVAHDLNQSLGMVAAYSDLARRALDDGAPNIDEARSMLETVAQAAMDGGASVHRLLVFARDRDSGTPERVELDPLLHDVATLTAPRWRDAAQAEGRPITVAVEAAFGAAVIGHPSALRQALTNLVLNAVDALPRGGAIHVSARIRGETVELAVADTGVGMTPEAMARAFEPFYSTKGDRGTGLGLPQVLAIAERHGGRALLASTPGRGTTVTLIMPVAAALAPSVDAEAADSAAYHGYVLRILAVEDEPRLAQALSIGLGLSGHSVAIASSGEEALDQLRGGQFDVLVTDLGLGTGMNGWELIERVRGTWSDLPIVLTTGWAGEIDPDEAKHRGVSAVVAKPYRIDGLVRTVEGQARRD